MVWITYSLSCLESFSTKRFIGQRWHIFPACSSSWQTLLMNHGILSHWAEMLPQPPSQLCALILCTQNIVLGLAGQQHLGARCKCRTSDPTSNSLNQILRFSNIPRWLTCTKKSDKCWFGQFLLIKAFHGWTVRVFPVRRHTARLCPWSCPFQVLIRASHENTGSRLIWPATVTIPEQQQKH